MKKNLTREELIEIGYKIVNAKGTEQETLDLYFLFSENVPHPNGANLFFHPEKSTGRKRIKYDPTVEEVVDIALNYKPIQL